jgi:hypothetical protein
MNISDSAAPPIRLIIAGGREFDDTALLDETMKAFCDAHYCTPDQLTIVCGMCRGADIAGLHWAIANNADIDRHPALWRGWNGKQAFNKAAGFQRNERMAKVATHLLAFWDGKSKGTADMIKLGGKYKLDVAVVMYE